MVNLKYWDIQKNIGDQLSPVVIKWVMNEKQVQDNSKGDFNLMGIGSILAARFFSDDSVVWGTGIHYIEDSGRLAFQSSKRKLDIRAVRGPITRRALEQVGYPCPHIYGDPAVLMPFVYSGGEKIPPKACSVIRQINDKDTKIPQGIKQIEIRTDDYKKFIDEIVSSERIISSSLHGIILAESYHVPAVWLVQQESKEFIKFFDWYYATGRTRIKIAHSIEEGMKMTPMKLPNLEQMQKQLLAVFPSDIFQPYYCYREKREVVLFGAGNCFLDVVDKIKRLATVRYVCDNDPSKWGMHFANLICISPMQLQKMGDIYVVITIANSLFSEKVASQLKKSNIFYYESVFEWLSGINYEKYY